MATRRPMSDKQREIRQTERSYGRMQTVKTREDVAREQAHGQQRVATESSLAGNRRKQRIVNAVGDKAVSTVTPSADSGLIMTTLFLIAGLALFYNLVTHAGLTSGFLGSAGDFLHKLSSTTPLFTTNATGSGTSTLPGGPKLMGTITK